MSDDFEDEDPFDLEDYPTLVAAARFVRTIPTLPWFDNLAAPIDSELRDDAMAYLAALGFPNATLAAVADWEDAVYAVSNPDWNSEWWEAEEQLRAALTDAAIDVVGEVEFAAALAHLNETMSEIIPETIRVTATYGGVSDEDVIIAAIGAATQACHVATLVVLAAEEEDHPMVLKFRLFEAGRWPLGITGNSFHLF